MKAGVIGHPIAHSKSPIIHGFWLKEHDIQGSYEAIDIAPDDLRSGVKSLIDNGFDGFNVTIPHKQAIMALCDEIDATAKKIGAVNTVVIKNGKLHGLNTDAFGFIQNIKTQSDVNFENKTALILGAGGASRAVIYGLQEAGVRKVILTNRTIENAQKLADDFDIEIIEWNDRSQKLSDIDLLINTTSLGMVGKAQLDINLEHLNSKALVCDIVYTPLMTPLLQQAQDQGNEVVTGIGMLLHQARSAFEAWTEVLPNVTAPLEELVLS